MDIDKLKDILVDFVLPTVIFLVLAALLASGKDGEVKTLMAAIVGWLTSSGVKRARTPTPKG